MSNHPDPRCQDSEAARQYLESVCNSRTAGTAIFSSYRRLVIGESGNETPWSILNGGDVVRFPVEGLTGPTLGVAFELKSTLLNYDDDVLAAVAVVGHEPTITVTPAPVTMLIQRAAGYRVLGVLRVVCPPRFFDEVVRNQHRDAEELYFEQLNNGDLKTAKWTRRMMNVWMLQSVFGGAVSWVAGLVLGRKVAGPSE